MKLIQTTLPVLFFAATVVMVNAQAQTDSRGDCQLSNLGACRDSNELFWKPNHTSGRSTPRHEFADVLAHFMSGAPKLYVGAHSFSAAESAAESLDGPGDHHDRLPGGEWFFDGFTPHDAMDKGGVIFDAGGNILAVALVDTATDTATPRPSAQDLSRFRLRIYSHDGEPQGALTQVLQNWAREVVGNKSIYPGVFPNSSLVGTEILVAEKHSWRTRSLP